jgi:hypothetical protein
MDILFMYCGFQTGFHLDFGRTVRRYQRGNQNANQRKTDNAMAKRKKDKRTSGDLQNNT